MDARITCIRKPHPSSPHEHITHVGNPAANWIWTREDVIGVSNPVPIPFTFRMTAQVKDRMSALSVKQGDYHS
jgi:hypothetical protein